MLPNVANPSGKQSYQGLPSAQVAVPLGGLWQRSPGKGAAVPRELPFGVTLAARGGEDEKVKLETRDGWRRAMAKVQSVPVSTNNVRNSMVGGYFGIRKSTLHGGVIAEL